MIPTVEDLMATLDPKNRFAVLINTFQVAPEKAEELLAILEQATDETMRSQPGFVSANLHISDDRTRIVNYAQWRTRADFEAMLKDPTARIHMRQAAEIATSFDPVIYELRYSRTAEPSS
jgi:quinol monooxygenase YgiN